MFIVGNLVMSLAYMVNVGLTALYWLILIRALISWVSPDPFNPIVQFLRAVTEPVLSRIRRYMPQIGPFDFSAIAAFLIIIFLRSFLVKSLFDLGLVLR